MGDPSTVVSSSRGKLWVRVVEARNINVANPLSAQPYCMVQFEGNEFLTKPGVRNPDTMVVDSPMSPSKSCADLGACSFKCPVWKHEAVFDVSHTDGEMIISIWDRPTGDSSHLEDMFLGTMRFRPPRVDGKLLDNWFRLNGRQWREKVTGEIHIQMVFQAIDPSMLKPSDFEPVRLLGVGGFGRVIQVVKKDTRRIYAMKILDKKDIIMRKEVAHTMAERNILTRTSFPFIVDLKFSFQTMEKLFLVLDYINGGELYQHLIQQGRFSEQVAQFYAAELLLALDELHKHNIIYRDLKLENVLLDSTGHIALTDFGLSKDNLDNANTATTLCGTPEYLAPEVLKGKGYNHMVDWWSFGVLVYELMFGTPPFHDSGVKETYRRILSGKFLIPEYFSPIAANFVTRLLDMVPSRRLGAGPSGAAEIKRHPFFNGINWDKLLRREVTPPYRPPVKAPISGKPDPTFLLEMHKLLSSSSDESENRLSADIGEPFRGFAYIGNSEILEQIGQHFAGDERFIAHVQRSPRYMGKSPFQ